MGIAGILCPKEKIFRGSVKLLKPNVTSKYSWALNFPTFITYIFSCFTFLHFVFEKQSTIVI